VFRFLLAPRWLVFHVFIAAALTVCIILGIWQFDVYRNSQDRHDERQREPVPLTELVSPGVSVGSAADRPVTVTGRYLADQQMLVPGRIHEDTLGSYVVTPVETDDGTIVPVLRGWVDEPTDAHAPVRSEVELTGHLLPPETADNATVRTGRELEDDQIAYVAPNTVASRTGLAEVAMIAGYVVLSAEQPQSASAPIALDVDAVAPIRNVNPWQNLSYWAQWWVIGIVVAAFWVSAVRAGVRNRRAQVSGPARSPAPS
jgi:cytochrome oxidase assembly protein ShyY1